MGRGVGGGRTTGGMDRWSKKRMSGEKGEEEEEAEDEDEVVEAEEGKERQEQENYRMP